MFDRVVHADWSTREGGRWAAEARRDGAIWRLDAPAPVGDLDAFRTRLLHLGRTAKVLAGFDFPIGVPAAYGMQTGLPDFRAALAAFGTAQDWRDVYDVAADPNDIALRRPFFPAGSGAGATRASLAAGLGLASANDLLRACERGGPGRKLASPLFWTVGAAQVGRAAIAGWRHAVAPSVGAGAKLWPFDGPLGALSARPGLVIAETYPADAYAAVGAAFRPGESKRRQPDRRSKAAAIQRWADTHAIDLSGCDEALRNGFGSARTGEDAFDALLGLLAMLAVVDGHRPATSEALAPTQLTWEGWILGR